MALEQVAASNQQEKDFRDVDSKEVKDLTKEEAKKLSDEIVSNPESKKQVEKDFPEYLDNYTKEERADFISQLQTEILEWAAELKSKWIEKEYTSEISDEDIKNAETLKFVTENKDKIPQQWLKIEAKADEIKKEMEQEIREEGIDAKLEN